MSSLGALALHRGIALARPWAGPARSAALILALWAAQPLFAAAYQQRLANLVLVQVIAALGVNVILGYAGLVSIAHGATMAIGGYASALLMMRLGWPFPMAFTAAVGLSGVISGLFGALGTRIKTNYFLLVTLAMAEMVTLVIVNENGVTGGPTGLFNVPPAAIGGLVADSDAKFYLLAVPFTVIGFYIVQRLRASKTGRAMFALRLNEAAASTSGVNVNTHRVAAMALGGAYLGAAGSLFAHLLRFLGPESFTLSLALLLTLMVVMGGIGSNWGVVVSVTVLTVATAQLQDVGNAWVLFYGLLIMAILVVAPRGVLSIASSAYRRVIEVSRKRWANGNTRA